VLEPPRLRPESLRRPEEQNQPKIDPSFLSVSRFRQHSGGDAYSLLEDALVDVGGPDPGDAEGEDGHAPRHAPAAAAVAVSGAYDAVDASADAAPARGRHGVGSPAAATSRDQ